MTNQSKSSIGVFFGGKSPEHDVSIITGQLIISTLKKIGYPVVPVYIGPKGEFYLDEKLDNLKFFSQTLDNREQQLKKADAYYLDLEKSRQVLIFKKKGLGSKHIQIDLAFVAFHGEYGEDGTIQGLFEMFNLPYVGCEVTASAIAIDKITTKLLYQGMNIPTTDFYFFNKTEWQQDSQEVLAQAKKLTWPLIVKPARLGSSIGMQKANNSQELENACQVALHYSPRVLVEEAVENLADLTIALLGNQKPKTSLIQESVFTDELFSYEEKYLKDGGAQTGAATKNLIIPANIDQQTTQKIKKQAKQIYKAIDCCGTARVDFLFNRKTKQLFANEINPLPGTLYHHLWKDSGLSIKQVVKTLIKLAQQRHELKNKFTRVFQSEILNQAKSIKLNLDQDKK
ncbi:MAG: D-alanine--D-alanine ligase [Candidatus Moranbacteria bacterium]|nr:D-alanine--D-alanine ligase [Candidatus Moranbacteria bacterium]